MAMAASNYDVAVVNQATSKMDVTYTYCVGNSTQGFTCGSPQIASIDNQSTLVLHPSTAVFPNTSDPTVFVSVLGAATNGHSSSYGGSSTSISRCSATAGSAAYNNALLLTDINVGVACQGGIYQPQL